ncbi:MAG TPA: glycosyltransferase family 4 protein [Candidatus Acidoferrum sp.]|nr:glycosyltransferase family 4 protein [Candidatus Acidoferrum sp.]
MSAHSITNPTRRNKIALCLEYPIDLQGGVSVLCAVLARHFSSRYEITLVSPDTEETLDRSPHRDSFTSLIRWDPQRASIATARELGVALAQHGVELAHFHYGGPFGFGNRLLGHSPIPCAVRRGVATCSTVHLVIGPLEGYCGPEKPWWFKVATWPVAWAGKMNTLRHLRREVTVSRWGEARLRNRYFPLRNRFQTIYHSRLAVSEMSASESTKERVVLSVGHVAPRKGQLILAQAFAKIASRHPDWNLLILGGINAPECEHQIRDIIARQRLQGRIEMLGSRPDALDFMRRAAVFVQPSFFEGLPLALQEAMLMRCACIGTNIPGNTEIVTDGVNGLLVPCGDVSSMADAIDRLLANDRLRGEFQGVARNSVLDKGMSVEHMVDEHARLYEQMLAEDC